MPFYPKITPTSSTRKMTDVFLGYDHRPRISDGAWYHMSNLSSRSYPLLSPREPRGTVAAVAEPQGIAAKDALAWVDGGTLYYNGHPTGLSGLSVPRIFKSDTQPDTAAEGDYWYSGLTGLTKRYSSAGWLNAPYPTKQLVGMGAYLCIFPDKKYINTADLTDFGSMEARFQAPADALVSYTLTRTDGTDINTDSLALSDTQPADPANGDHWIDTSGESYVISRYSSASGAWVQIPTVYTRISCPGIGANFAQYDGVTISGCSTDEQCAATAQIQALNGEAVIYDRGDDYISVVGLISMAAVQTGGVTVERSVPEMDYVCECGNRLWGCYYGLKDGRAVNELYCCALGDFKNWRRYMGISTDAWAAGVGSDGPWTGAVNYLGYPTFFKEDRIHTVSISSAGAHQVDDIAARGVQKGSHRSLAVAGETLYYLSPGGVCAYQGGLPVKVSDALGDQCFYEGSGGAAGGKYYISMRSDEGWGLFVLDTALGLWHREDALHAPGFAPVDNDLVCIDLDGGSLLALKGSRGEPESSVPWEAVSGIMYYDDPDHKYLSRYNLRLRMDEGASLRVYICYDSSGLWEEGGSIAISGTDTVTLPIRPRRCDHMQLKLMGQGPVLLYSIARIYESGSDAG